MIDRDDDEALAGEALAEMHQQIAVTRVAVGDDYKGKGTVLRRGSIADRPAAQRDLDLRIADDGVVFPVGMCGDGAGWIPDFQREGAIVARRRRAFGGAEHVGAAAVGDLQRPHADVVAPVSGELGRERRDDVDVVLRRRADRQQDQGDGSERYPTDHLTSLTLADPVPASCVIPDAPAGP